MDQVTCLLLFALAVCVFLYIFNTRNPSEPFAYPPSMISAGDFDIQQPGAIADQGSFVNDMDDYLYGE